MHFRNYLVLILSASLSAAAASAQPYAYVANIGGAAVSVVNTANHTLSAQIGVPASPAGIAVTPDGSHVYVGSQGTNTVSVINTSNNSIAASIQVGTTSNGIAISPNGAYVYVSNSTANKVTVISTSSNSVVGSINVGTSPKGIAFSPDSSRAYVANMASGNLSVINTSNSSVINTVSTGMGAIGVAVTPAGQVYVSNSSANTVTVHDASGNLVRTIGGFTYPNGIAATPDGTRVYVANTNAASVAAISTSSYSVMTTTTVGSIPIGVAISTDGSSAMVTNETGLSLSILSTSSNALMNTLRPVGVYPYAVAMKPGTSSVSPPPTCTLSLASNSTSMGNGGANAQVGVTMSSSSCSWSVSSDSNWLTVTSPQSGYGNTTVTFSVTTNTGGARTGHLSMDGQTYTVNQAGASFSPIRLNAGGGQVTDSSGAVWSAGNPTDYSITHKAIGGSTGPMYDNEAFSTSTLQYTFTVPNGSHTVTLKFAEFYMTQRGQRTFNIVVNGSTWMSGFDILAYTSPNTAYDVNIPVTVSNGQVTVQLVPVTGSVKVNAIEIQ